MRNIDQRSRSLSERLSVQVRNSILRDHKPHMRSRGDHTGSLPQEAHDLALSLLRRGRHRNDRLSALRPRRSINEIDLSAEAREDPRSDRVAHDLSGQIDLDRRVDRHHLGHLRDHEGVVRESHVADLDRRVVVHELVRLLRPHHEAGRRAAAIQRLLRLTLPPINRLRTRW